MKINPTRLKSLRRRAGLSRARLARESSVSPKQIQRLESTSQSVKTSRKVTIDRLAAALRVKPEVLTSDKPLTSNGAQDNESFGPPTIHVHHRLWFGAWLAYDLVEERYGVRATEIINAAPLFFVLLAESSRAWRRKELSEIREAIKNLKSIGASSKRKEFLMYNSLRFLDFDYEERALENNDLFSDPFACDPKSVFDESTPDNPFIEYLQKLCEDLNISGTEICRGFVWNGGLGGPLRYSVCADRLKEIAQSNSRAQFALQASDARIADIPKDLQPNSAAEQREEWLASKMSERTTRWFEEWDQLWKVLDYGEDGKPISNSESEPKEMRSDQTNQ